jgi:hypothetical protein
MKDSICLAGTRKGIGHWFLRVIPRETVRFSGGVCRVERRAEVNSWGRSRNGKAASDGRNATSVEHAAEPRWAGTFTTPGTRHRTEPVSGSSPPRACTAAQTGNE